MADAPQPAAPPKFSLARLSTAFAKLMASPAASDVAPSAADSPPPPASVSPKAILEGLLFVGNAQGEPLSREALAKPIRDIEPTEIDDLVEELNEDYASDGSALEIVKQANGYRMQLASEFQRLRARFHGQVREAKLTPAALEVLSIVAYRQPLATEQINRLRGARSHAILANLVRRELLKVERREDAKRTAIYATTVRFNRLFGISSPAELPRIGDHEDG